MPSFVGLDWGGACHAVCVIGTRAAVIDRLAVRHDGSGLVGLLARLRRLGSAADLPIAVERPSGLFVEQLVAAGDPLVPIHPNVVKACRPRYRAANAKSDPGDAYMLTDILRTDRHRLRQLQSWDDGILALRALVPGRDDLVARRVSLTNQLQSLLDGFWPGAASIFAYLASPRALAFVARCQTPNSAARLGEKRLQRLLAAHASCGRRTPYELLARLRAAPEGHDGSLEAEAKGELDRALAALLQGLVAEVVKLTSRIAHEVAQRPEGRIVMFFPRAGQICAAQITAELGSVRDRFPSEAQLAGAAGVATVTHASGNSRGVTCRFACSKRRGAAVTCFADNPRHAL